MRHLRGYNWSWLVLVGVAAGCNAKLTVDPGTGGAQGFPAGAQGYTAGAQNGPGGGPGNTAGAFNVAGDQGVGGGHVAGDQGVGGSNVAGDQGVGGGHVAGDQGVGGGHVAGYQGVGGDFSVGGSQGGDSALPDYAGYGNLGESCVPGQTIYDGAGVVKTQLNLLEHCHSGLACSDGSSDGSGGASTGHCIPIPACPNARDLCVEQDVLGAGGTSGAGGAGAIAGAPSAGAGTIAQEEQGVTAMAVDANSLYWVQYGTRDSLGNYQNDGALKAMKFADRSTTTLAAGLAGPNALAVTSAHVYVMSDGGGLVGTAVERKLLRFPLSGGSAEPIQAGTPPLDPSPIPSLAAHGAVLYWAGSDAIYSLSDDASVPTAVASNGAEQLRADNVNLFFQDSSDGELKSVPATGGAATPLGLDSRPFDLNSDSIYGLEAIPGCVLSKAAKSNGSWLRVRALGDGHPIRLQFAGDRFFFETSSYSTFQKAVSTGQLGVNAPLSRLLDFDPQAVVHWVGTADTFYWTDTRRIYSRAVPTP